MTLYIGLMSGTSMDGIDAALVDLPANKLIYGLIKNYSDEVKKRLNELLDGSPISLASVCQLNTLIGRDFAAATQELLQEAKISSQDIKAIGSHGQTVCHDASASIPYTLQLGCAHTISSLTGITVVADFRTRDVVNGGQGAPFAPLYHQELFSKLYNCVAVVNIGGVSNCTIISSNELTKGWDVGPGNCLMDAWIQRHLGKAYDLDGNWAKQGTIIDDLLAQLLSDPFLSLAPPKSIGKEYYSLSWLEQFLKKDYKPVDVQATLLAFTAHCIATALSSLKTADLKQVFLCGGGAHNSQLLTQIANFLPAMHVQSSAAVGVDPDYLEAMMFAWLAYKTINGHPLDLSAITGSKGAHVLGALYPKPGDTSSRTQ